MKIKLFILICITCFVLVACGNNDNIEEQGKDNSTIEIGTEKNTEENISKIDLVNTHQVPGYDIVIDTPNYQNVELAYTEMYIIHESKYVSFTYNKHESVSDLKEAHTVAYQMFLTNIDNYNFGELTITSEKYVTINGIDMYRYEGTIAVQNETESHDGYAVGYSFIMDGVPCTVGGAVLEEAQSDEIIKEIQDTIEAMILTLRSER